MKKVMVLIVAVALPLFVFQMFSSCNKDSDFNVSLLHADYAKLWVLSEMWVGGVQPDISTLSDEHMLLTKDNMGMQIFGESDTKAEDTLTVDHFTYEILNDGKQIRFSELHESHVLVDNPELEIVSLTDDRLELRYNGTSGTLGSDAGFVYVPAVTANPDASANNYSLTNGNVKIWKMMSILREGESESVVVPCRADDYYLFATDGTGLKVFGDLHCVPGDTINNDHLNWKFIENETRIVRSEMHTAWTHDGGQMMVLSDTMKIISLTGDEFVYETRNVINGQPRNVIITYTPLIVK
jgi:hypothetical protein